MKLDIEKIRKIVFNPKNTIEHLTILDNWLRLLQRKGEHGIEPYASRVSRIWNYRSYCTTSRFYKQRAELNLKQHDEADKKLRLAEIIKG